MSGYLNTIVSILEFILAFGVLIFLHEFGHFIVARLNHIEVEEFGFGFPPKMVKLFRWKETDFTLNWIPFGGFCRMKGESASDLRPGSFAAASPWRRLATLLGGPIMNLLLGFILITFLITKIGTSDPTRVQVISVANDSPAAIAMIQSGDIIQQVNRQAVTGLDSLSSLIKLNLNKPTELTILRGTEIIAINLVPRANPPEGEGAMGVSIGNPTIQVPFYQAIPAAFMSTLDQGVQLIMLPVKLISGQVAPSETRLVSVVGLYDMFDQVKAVDAEGTASNPANANLYLLSYLASLSIALGYTNLLPIPAIDGGRILFIIPELLFHKKVRPELENRVHMIGFSILMILMVVLVINDIINPMQLP